MEDIIARNNVQIIGSRGPAIMFAHGFIGDQRLWRFMAPEFSKKYKVILFDFMGSGSSDLSRYDSKKYSRLEGYAEDVIDICRALKLKKIYFVGHSIASMIGLIASIQHPEYFSKMVFIGPSPSFINEGTYFGGFEKKDVDNIIEKIESDYTSWANDIAPKVINAPDRPELAEELVNSLLTRDQKASKLFASATFFSDYRKELLKFKTPSLIVQCTEDIMAPLQVGDYLHAHLENSELKILKANGHFPQLSAPNELTKVITKFLLGPNKNDL